MYLIIGDPTDRCCDRVEAALQRRGHQVRRHIDPLTAPAEFVWTLDSAVSDSRLSWLDGNSIDSADLRGVFVRGFGGPARADEWTADGFAYASAEGRAALVAWLSELQCPVLNRVQPASWFRPQRWYPEWHSVFAKACLPAPNLLVTTSEHVAKRFCDAHKGRVRYAPLTSQTRFVIESSAERLALRKVMATMPVCLLPAYVSTSTWVTAIGGRAIWNEHSGFTPAEQASVQAGMTRTALNLGLDTMQFEVVRGRRGPECLSAQTVPHFDYMDSAAQDAYVEAVMERLS